MDFVVDNYRSVVARFESTIENIEANMFQSEFDQAAIENVYTLRRHLLALRNAALPMDEICNQLIRLHEEVIPKSCAPMCATCRITRIRWSAISTTCVKC